MKRLLFNAGALVSLLVAVLAAAFWLRSHSYLEGLAYADSPTSSVAIDSSGGYITLWRYESVTGQDWRPGWHVTREEPVHFQYAYKPFIFKRIGPARWVHVHYWLVTALAIMWPILWCWRRWVSRKPATACPACGYDLRGTLSGGGRECPECGAAFGNREAKA